MKIGFSSQKKNNLHSYIIRFVMGAPFVHTYIEIDWNGTPMIFQSSKFFVNIVSKEFFLTENKIFEDFEIPEVKEQNIYPFIKQTLGLGYDFPGLIGMAVVILGKRLGYDWSNPWSSKNVYFCSELAADVLEQNGLYQSERPEDTSPKDLYWYLRGLYGKT